MLTFAQNLKPTPQAKTASSTKSRRVIPEQSREVSSILHLQRSAGNQAGQRLSQIDAEKREDASLTSTSPRPAHDFSSAHADAAITRPEVMQLHDMEGPAAEENIGQLADNDGGPAPGPAPPAPAPSPPPPAAPLGPIPAATLNVTVPTKIRAASTPKGMPDRIPPRVDTPVSIGITGWLIPMLDVTISVDGAGSGNGTVTVDGANSVDLNASATVKLRGVDQTDVGKAGGLRLIAKQGPALLASSTGFSVSAIPQNWSTSFKSLITGTKRGIKVDNSWESDSGNLADLDKAERSEQVQYGAGSGSLAGKGAGAQNSGYLAADSSPVTDSHGTPVAFLTSPGSIAAEQTFIFKDKRTGATDIPARNSGFRLSRDVEEPTPGNLEITTAKQGTKTTANGFSSDAGSGSVSKKQAV